MSASRLVAGVPVVSSDTSYLRGCLAALLDGTVRPERIYVVDNRDVPLERESPWPESVVRIVRPERNLGCAGSWNLILALAAGTPTLLVNDDCEVARDTLDRLSRYPEPSLVCAHGFSCFRIDSGVVASVGTFDEAYFPVYWEDTDYRYRCRLEGVSIVEWPREPVEPREDDREISMATGIVHGKSVRRPYQEWDPERQAFFRESLERNHLRYVRKWGGEPGSERFRKPFDRG